jgi:acetamidase/formamidase
VTATRLKHTIHAEHHHWWWDRAIPPVLEVEPGTVIDLELNDPGGGQIGPGSSTSELLQLDFSRINPVTGPVWIDGAEPGDAVHIELLSVEPCGWGWSALIPRFGLLADDFLEPHLVQWHYDRAGQVPAALQGAGRVPTNPMIGSLGLAPGAPGPHDILPPRRVGGTMDIRDMVAGSILCLPVEVAGALLSCGDGHAAQGDGEVCGTGLETALKVSLRVNLEKHAAPRAPRFSVPGPVTSHLDEAGYDVTTGVGPDLMTGARDAVRSMIDLLSSREKMTPEDAYILCSVAGDLRISEIVDAPNWIVSFYFPRIVLE